MNIEHFVYFTPIKQIEYKKWILPLAVMLAVVLLSAYRESLGPYDYTSDQYNYGVMILNALKPENLANDYMWQDPTYSTFYTPSYRLFIIPLTRLFGGFGRALNVVMIPAALLFLIFMTGLCYQVTGSRWLSTAIAVAAALFHYEAPVGGHWGPMLSVSGMTPRNFFLSFTPLLFGWLFHTLSAAPRRWTNWIALGFGFGLAANIHPVSGYVTAGVLGMMVILAAIRGKIRWSDVLWTGLGGLIGALPLLIAFVNRSEAVPVSDYTFTFQEFLAAGRAIEYSRVWPWQWPVQQRRLTHYFLPRILSGGPLLILFGTHAILTIAAAGGLWLTRRQPDSVWRRVSFAVLVATQTLMVVFFVNEDGITSFFMALYALHIFLHKQEPDWIDRRLYEILSILILLTSLSIVVQFIWIRYEVWGLTAWGRMLPRGLRFTYLPAFLMIGRLLLYWQREYGWTATLAGLTMLFFPVKLRSPENYLILIFAVVVFGWTIWPERENRPPFIKFAVMGAATVFVIERVMVLLAVQSSHLPSVIALILVVGLAWLRETRPDTPLALRYGLIGGALLIGLLVPQRYRAGEAGQPLVIALQGSGEAIAENVPWFNIVTVGPEEAALRAMAEWARDNTPIDSVFYLDDLKYDHNTRFRFYAERSVTHSAKDRAIAYVLQYPFVEMVRRGEELQSGFESVEALTRLAAKYQADYVGLPTSSTLSPGWPVVYQNGYYTLYQVP